MKAPQMAYIAFDESGFCCAAIVDDLEARNETAKHIGRWVKNGCAIERVTIEEAGEALAAGIRARQQQTQLELPLQVGTRS